jgi:hypothetical protein
MPASQQVISFSTGSGILLGNNHAIILQDSRVGIIWDFKVELRL